VPILNVEYPKDVTMKATEGNATFTAVIAKDGRPDKYTYQWYVEGAPIAGATNATYVRNVSGDKGQYTVWCEVANKAGTVRTREAKLTVYRIPVLNASYPANTSAIIGNSVSFKTVIAEKGYPDSYSYQWYLNGSPVSGANSATYTRTTTGVGTSRVYCVVSNAAGTVASRTAEYRVNPLVLFPGGIGWTLVESPDQSLTLGGASDFEVVTSGYVSASELCANMYLYQKEGYCYCQSENFDLTPYSKIVVTKTDVNNNGFIGVGGGFSVASTTSASLDISGITGSYPICFGFPTRGRSSTPMEYTSKATQIRLE
jgi:hypothetical protein